jgi:hypothetical protein
MFAGGKMMNSYHKFAAVVILISFAVFAQPNLSTVSVKIGSIRNLLEEDASSGEFALYPELQIGGNLTSEHINWAFYWGYWSDGFANPQQDASNETLNFSQISHIVGARIYFSTPNVFGKGYPVDIAFLAGFSHHFIQSKFSETSNQSAPAEAGEIIKNELNNAEFGLMVGFLVAGPVKLIGEIQQFIPINAENIDVPSNRRAYKTGLSISF